MGYVFDFKDAVACQKWVESKHNNVATHLETALMCNMLQPVARETVLDIGCGVGASLQALLEHGLEVTGIDPSPYMLDMARKNMGERIDLYRGFAEELPFEDNSFNHAVFFTSLEFVDDPRLALREACRVAKDKIFIGVLNRYAIKSVQRRLKGVFAESIYNRARFFSVWELKAELQCFLNQVPVRWETIYHLPLGQGRIARTIESAKLMRMFPFGSFAGVSALLIPRLRTRPLALKYRPNKMTSMTPGSIPTKARTADQNRS